MYTIKRKKLGKIIFLSILTIIIGIFVVMLNSHNYQERTLTIANIEEQEVRFVVKFKELDNKFIISKDHIENSVQYIQVDKQASVIYDINSHNNYIPLYKLEIENKQIVNYVDEIINDNKDITLSLIFLYIGSFITIMGLILKGKKCYTNSEDNFVIKNPAIVVDFAVYFIYLGIFAFLYYVIYSIFNDFSTCLPVFILGLVVGLIGGIILFIYINESFIYDGTKYYYNHFYLKKESVNKDDIKSVVLQDTAGILSKVLFIGKDGKIAISFFDDGTSFQHQYFEKSLKKNNIKIIKKI